MNIIDSLKEKYGSRIKIEEKNSRRVFIKIAKNEAPDLLRHLHQDLGARFSTASGVDTRQAIEILYHLAFDQHQLVVTVKVLVEKPQLEMASVANFIEAANWIEREIQEMFGVKFVGHPKMETLLLSEDWPAGVYPLRKQTFESEQENAVREN